jgi:hypothetical protein
MEDGGSSVDLVRPKNRNSIPVRADVQIDSEVHCFFPETSGHFAGSKPTRVWSWPIASLPPSTAHIKTHGTTLDQYGIVLLWSIGTLPHICYCLQRLRFFLGTFAKLRKATLSFVVSVRLSAWNNSAQTGRIFVKSYIWLSFSAPFKKFKFH